MRDHVNTLPGSEKDHRRATAYAAKWHAEHERAEPPRTEEPTDSALAECFRNCVRPARAELYPLIRLFIGAYAGDTTALAAAIEANPRFRSDDGRVSGRLFDDYAHEYGRDVTGLAWVQAILKASQDPNAAGTCQDCGGPAVREDEPLPAAFAPVPWWHHASEADARSCPGRGPVVPAPGPGGDDEAAQLARDAELTMRRDMRAIIAGGQS